MLNNENYFSSYYSNKYMSVSQFKSFDKCQASALAELRGDFVQPTTVPLLVGSYVDAYFEGTLLEFQAVHPELFTKQNKLKAPYIKAVEIINRVTEDELFMEYMSGEKQVIMTGTIKNVPIKIKIDSLCSDKIVDLKIMKDFKDIYVPGEGRLSFIEAWKYDLQGAVYQEIVYQNTGKKLPFFIAGATKEPITDFDLFEVSQEYLDFELEHFKKNVEYYNAVKNGALPAERCGKCDYCKLTKKLTKPIRIEEFEYE